MLIKSMQAIFSSQMNLELFGNVPLLFGIGVQIISALVLGGLVGYDREVKMKAAGLKTNIMICIGATLYTTMSIINLNEHVVGAAVDPNRIAAQIVSGIGFLGAGAIIQSRGSVTGLTTAATMWVVAAIGYTIGIGHIVVAFLFSLTTLLVLRMINPINKIIERETEHKTFHLEVLAFGDCMASVKNFLSIENIELIKTQTEQLQPDSNKTVLNVYLKGHPKCLERVSLELMNAVKIKEVHYYEIYDIQQYFDEKTSPIKIVNE
jgi:putative Mg2+ transporter-C (MgtC) family protein